MRNKICTVIIDTTNNESEHIMNNHYIFKCPKCKCDVDYVTKQGIAECDTPVGTIQTAEKQVFCATCGEQLFSRQLRDENYILMVRATMALWRSQNPQGTKKQCRRKLGLNKATVDNLWNHCMSELPVRKDETDEQDED